MKKWNTQFANDPRRGFELYLELLEGEEPRAQIVRAIDGELYLNLFAYPEVRVPFHWLAQLQSLAETLPSPVHEAD